ncbi:MAG: CoA transferase, partial [Candidatus Tectomicrobia bacterium]|nr:CoA transferase [Candidatus Tectomicrobia bacterium]
PQEMERLGLDFESLKKINPKLIMTSLTPFGQTGPYRNYKATDLVSFHMGGYGYHITGPVDDPNSQPPLKPRGHHANFAAGITGAAATLSAIFARKKTNQGQHVDISEQETRVPFVFGNVANYAYKGKGNNRWKSKNPPTGIVAVLPAKDGAVSISPRESHLWARWVEVMGNPEWAKDERFKDRASRVKNWSTLQPLIAEWTKERPKDEIYKTAQAKRVPAFPVNTIEAVFQSEQFRARGFFKEIDHSIAGILTYPTVPYQFSRTPWEVAKSAPLLGEHNEAILCERLGYSKSDLVKLREGGII